ncbi:YegS/Rv2252/BmrU family lipid kinase [Fusibacter sp. 3D3]|uniref:YegS/Rv2252/BmrU family lipid kinase n=1 Tax=Fusibacter sp. 3D3 TaxID=1048380 RepID=UPI000853CC3A|nr:YegS/Rv2252/BmrU family lipid kinase [Fusibacter sp. 3D3]GAU78093.1 transcription regulator [Fusibacter sp. 3D3]
MKALLLYNPRAGLKGFHNQLDYIIDQFQQRDLFVVPYRLNQTKRLEVFLSEEIEAQYDRVIIAGGDGTIHQVINVLINLNWTRPIAIFPVGTANDFAQMFEIPKTIEGMVENALSQNSVPCDVGVANDRYFINVASFGYLVDISQKVNEQVKNIIGVLAYYLKGIEEFPKLKPFEVTIFTDETVYEEPIYFALVMNGKSAGGFRKISPTSKIDDGVLDVLLFKKCPVLEIMPLLIQVWNGEHPESPYIEYFATKKLKIMCDESICSDLDGEAGIGFPMEISVLSNRLNIIKG